MMTPRVSAAVFWLSWTAAVVELRDIFTGCFYIHELWALLASIHHVTSTHPLSHPSPAYPAACQPHWSRTWSVTDFDIRKVQAVIKKCLEVALGVTVCTGLSKCGLWMLLILCRWWSVRPSLFWCPAYLLYKQWKSHDVGTHIKWNEWIRPMSLCGCGEH